MASSSSAQLKQQITAFLLNEGAEGKKYIGQVQHVKDGLLPRFLVNINDLRAFDAALAARVVRAPVETVVHFEAVVKELLLDSDPLFFARAAESRKLFFGPSGDRDGRVAVGFEGHFGEGHVTPRSLAARHLSTMVCVQGIVTRCSLVRPKVARSVHYNPTKNEFEARSHHDATDFVGAAAGAGGGGPGGGGAYPTKDREGNLLETEVGLSHYRDSQTVTIQEMPESAPFGQLPRSVDIALDGDLVDAVKPGDRVAATGVYRALAPASAGGGTSGAFRTALLANHVRRLGKDAGSVVLTERDVDNARAFAHAGGAFDALSRSLAPSIYGHRVVKQALALLLAGGVEHVLPNGTHIRGDVNLLMVGDPSTAKSQLLRFVLNLAPVAVATTGRGSSGVGLTAAVTTDPETGERRLEAGAMVLADRGVVVIDEFDKMSDADRVAIHEVMEQQTVTIAKAGIQASLNARCSVVAAANPVYGRFDPGLPLSKNVALPDSLLSRFDMLFIIRDAVSREGDLRLAEHVLRMHRYVRPGQEGVPVRLDATLASEAQFEEDAAADGTSPVYIKYNPILHGGLAADEVAPGGGGITRAPPRLLSLDFVRKYLHFVKSAVQPTLTSRARAAVVDAYNGFRQRVAGRATLITARSLETIIRLASAHAKLRLQPSVMVTDVDVATRIMTYALYGEESSVPYSGGGDGAKAATAVLPARPLTPARQHGGPRADAVVGGNGGVHGGQDAGGAAVGGASGGLPDVSGNHDDDDGGIVSHDGPRAAGVPSDAALYGVTDEAVAAAFSAAGPAAGAAVDVAGADHLAVRRALTRLATSRGGEVPLGAELASVLARDAAPQALLSDRDGLLRWLAAHLHALVIDGKVVVADGVVVIV